MENMRLLILKSENGEYTLIDTEAQVTCLKAVSFRELVDFLELY